MSGVVCKKVNTKGSRVFMGCVTDGVALHAALAQLAVDHDIATGTFELLGGLHEVTLAAYDFDEKERLAPIVLKRPLEIISGHGTISVLGGEPHVHMHLSLSFRDDAYPHGIGMVGGHAARAVAFAVEFTLTAYDGEPMRRGLDERTGLRLWR